LKNPDAVVAVTFDMAIEFKEIANREIQVVTNGFAFEDFKNFTSKKSNKLLVFHHGSLNADRNPVKFWKFLGEITKTNEDWKNNLEIQLVGAVDISVLQEIEKNGLLKYLQVKSFMPHSEVIEALSYATLCLLPLNNTPNAKGIMPNKLYEYLATGKPIIVIGPKDGDTAGVIMSFENCCVFDFEEDIEYLVLRECLKKGEISHDLSMFNRYNLAVEIDKLLQSL
jgi:glycosyltransferase involved in cell wall biosynthesis